MYIVSKLGLCSSKKELSKCLPARSHESADQNRCCRSKRPRTCSSSSRREKNGRLTMTRTWSGAWDRKSESPAIRSARHGSRGHVQVRQVYGEIVKADCPTVRRGGNGPRTQIESCQEGGYRIRGHGLWKRSCAWMIHIWCWVCF